MSDVIVQVAYVVVVLALSYVLIYALARRRGGR